MITQQLRYVLMLAKIKSFSKAAKELYITQPALSLYIINLEDELGAKLFDRSSSPIKLTSIGVEYVKTAQKILDIESELNKKISDILESKQGSISVGITPVQSSLLLEDTIIKYTQKNSLIKINIIEKELIELQDNVLNGAIDFFIGNYSVQNDQLIMDIIGEELLFLAVPKNNSSNKGLEQYQVPLCEIIDDKYTTRTSVDFSAFSNDPFITLQPSQHIHTVIIDICRNAGFEPNIVLQTNKPDIAYSLVQRGLGSTIVSETLIRRRNIENHPAYYRLPEKFAVRNIIIVHRKNRYISNIAEEFISIYKENLVYGKFKSI
jgi:DNA-binding transcriptional LysR family regulator